jgi:hypothetical protein
MGREKLILTQEMSLMDISSTENFKDTAILSLNPINTKASLKMENTMDKESILGAQGMSTKAHIKMARSMDMESIQALMGLFTREIGRMVNDMEKEFKYHLPVLFRKYCLIMASRWLFKIDPIYILYSNCHYQVIVKTLNHSFIQS